LKGTLMLLVMKKVLIFGVQFECQEIEFHIFQNQKTGGQRVILDLVDLIQKFFIGFEKVNFLQREVMLKMMKIIGWKYGIMFLWNITNFQTES
jgi:hypothetical protein